MAHLVPFALADRAVTCGEWLAFMDDGGYERPELWLSDGWAVVQQQRWDAPLYWSRDGGEWSVFTLAGAQPVRDDEPVCHVSYYEADAYAHWTGGRLPTEAEWEAVAAAAPVRGQLPRPGRAAPPRPSGARPRAVRRRLGVDVERLQPLPRVPGAAPARSASTTASSW